MIIVEGPDNSGKSTLIKQLLELDPALRLLKRERFNPKNGETIGSSYLDALLPPEDGHRANHGHSIADRFFASECIYGRLYRGGCRMTPHEHFMIKTLLLSYGAFVVHCDPPNDVIFQTWHEREQLYDRDPEELACAYRMWLQRIFFPIAVQHYDWTAENAATERQLIIDHHNYLREQHAFDLQWKVTGCLSD